MILGIDPGLSGAMALLTDTGGLVMVEDLPTMAVGKAGRRQINAAGLAARLRQCQLMYSGEYRAVLEDVHAMPKQGVSSVFSFGRTLGQIEGVLATLKIAVVLVRPVTWKKHYNLGRDKEQARALAIQYFPGAELHLKKHADRAEAILLARWGVRP